jgi:predicted small integral membrane protein
MNEFYPLFDQAAVVAIEAAWLSVAVYDNFRHPTLNQRGFATVLTMDLVRQQDPDAYREVWVRRIDDPDLEDRLFHLLVAAEATVAALLWLGALGLLLASFGIIDHPPARAFAMIAVVGFTALWGGMLIGGEWFWYRIGMAPAMQAHFFLIIWGIATLAFLATAP